MYSGKKCEISKFKEKEYSNQIERTKGRTNSIWHNQKIKLNSSQAAKISKFITQSGDGPWTFNTFWKGYAKVNFNELIKLTKTNSECRKMQAYDANPLALDRSWCTNGNTVDN